MSDILSGVIVCGYPGVGKSAIGGWWNCIDLESSYFSMGWTGGMVLAPKDPISLASLSGHNQHEISTLKIPDWVAQYVDVGVDLAAQGFTVLMSTHKNVIDFLKAYTAAGKNEGTEVIPKIVIFCPKKEMKDAWIKRLQTRYDQSGSPKDFRALRRAQNYFDADIEFLTNTGFPVYQPGDINYNLKTYISFIRDMVQNVEETRIFLTMVKEAE